jgi:hypothetical protein
VSLVRLSEVTYTLKTQAGESFPVRSRLWLVPRGTLMFLIGMSGALSGEDECDRECDEVLGSIAIER